VDRGASNASAVKAAPEISCLKLSFDTGHSGTVTSISDEAIDDLESRVEGYSLTLPADGSAATIQANSTLGLFRGLTTFGQLWYYVDNITYAVDAPMEITDSPVYPYRGFMLDTARNFFPVSDILRTLDAMSWVKINTFHWHMVDSQSFPIEVPEFPLISANGAYGPTFVYSTADVQNIITYAAARGIDVLPEVDTPGHTAIISESYPEHVACPQATPWATYANEPPAGQLRFASANTTNFTASLLSSISARFPGKYFSTGGDEINTECYTVDEPTQQALNASGQTFEQALDTFTGATHGVLQSSGKTTVVWEEMVLDFNLTSLRNDTIVMVWISSEDAAAVASAGFRLVQAPSNYFYLDCGGGGWVGDFPSGNSWCDPFKTWSNAYNFDPIANMTAEQAALVIGGEQLLWTEQSHASNLDPIVWPRAAASAEIFWSGPGDVDTALPRLHDVAFRMAQRGVGAIPLQPMWCALRPFVCDLLA